MNPENEANDGEADNTDDQVGGLLGKSLRSSLLTLSIGVIRNCLGFSTKLGLSLSGQDLNDDKWNEVDDADSEQLHVEASLVEAGGQKCTDWSEKDVKHDDELGHVSAHLRGDHDARLAASKNIVTAIELEGGLLLLGTDQRVTDGSLDHLLFFLLDLVHLNRKNFNNE